MRRFINSTDPLNESFTGNPQLDQHIEDVLPTIATTPANDDEQREMVRDLLFLVKKAGPEGARHEELMLQFTKLYPEENDYVADHAIQLMRRYFPDIVDFHHDSGRYVFVNPYAVEAAAEPQAPRRGQRSMDFLRDLADRATRTGKLDPTQGE